jgi:hypothetical protein
VMPDSDRLEGLQAAEPGCFRTPSSCFAHSPVRLAAR